MNILNGNLKKAEEINKYEFVIKNQMANEFPKTKC